MELRQLGIPSTENPDTNEQPVTTLTPQAQPTSSNEDNEEEQHTSVSDMQQEAIKVTAQLLDKMIDPESHNSPELCAAADRVLLQATPKTANAFSKIRQKLHLTGKKSKTKQKQSAEKKKSTKSYSRRRVS